MPHSPSYCLSIVPPYMIDGVPAGPAALLGYLKAKGCQEFSFLDLRLNFPNENCMTYATTGIFGQSYVMDIPDLPIVLRLLNTPLNSEIKWDCKEIRKFCLNRAINFEALQLYLYSLECYITNYFRNYRQLKLIGFSVWTSNYLSTLLACRVLKGRKKPPAIVLGGPQVTESKKCAELSLRSGLSDIVVLGEGEQALFEIYDSFDATNNEVAMNVPRTMCRTDFGVSISSGKLADIKSLPCPSFEEFNIPSYNTEDFVSLPYQFSRGCTDKCTFCSEWVFWEKIRLDSVGHTLENIEKIRKTYDNDAIDFTDSLLNGSHNRLMSLCEELIKRKAGISWSSFMRAQMDVESARILKRSGCSSVFVGIESLSNQTLETMNKRRTEADNLKALVSFLEAKISVTAGLIPGFPGDDREDFFATLYTILEIKNKYPNLLRVNVEPFITSPSQPMFNRLEHYGLSGNVWGEDVISMAPSFSHITEDIFEDVVGSNQGIERLGRHKAVETMYFDDKIKSDSWAYSDNLEISYREFIFDHLINGYYIAQIVAPKGHTYSLIIDSSEHIELSHYQATVNVSTLNSKRRPKILTTIENKHIFASNY
ncbi:MAG: B12-binding domain-containing radical SAM protein, partial [Pseudomonadales bacterium]|nr:B12-binding domain-containing radical SAM protein [Pseudomonadales bacterium]